MTEELEKKLNELLGLKKQFEEATDERRRIATSSVLEQYKKEARRARIRFLIGFVMGLLFMLLGILGLCSTKVIIMGHDISGTPAQYVLGAIALLVGVFDVSLTVIASCIRQSKLAILAEFKQFELRITEMLRK
jgi:hypothetical protein